MTTVKEAGTEKVKMDSPGIAQQPKSTRFTDISSASDRTSWR